MRAAGADTLQLVLRAKRTDAVLDYLESCKRFWERDVEQLEEWRKAIARGELPWDDARDD